MVDLVYGETHEGLVFIPRDLAEELATIHRGFATWGDARRELKPERWAEMVKLWKGATPSDDAKYEFDDIPGASDGDWPEWPSQMMIEWMPRHIVDEFGVIETSHINGLFVTFEPKFETAIVDALTHTDFRTTRDDKLVSDAFGYV